MTVSYSELVTITTYTSEGALLIKFKKLEMGVVYPGSHRSFKIEKLSPKLAALKLEEGIQEQNITQKPDNLEQKGLLPWDLQKQTQPCQPDFYHTELLLRH